MVLRRVNGVMSQRGTERRGMRSRATTPGAEESKGRADCDDLFLHPHHLFPFPFLPPRLLSKY